MSALSRYVILLTYLNTLNRVSVTVNLRQGLLASDTRQIIQCLTNVDVKTIIGTTKELTGEEATRVLEILGDIMLKDPRRGNVVVEWTRAILMAHASYLASQTRTKLHLKIILDSLQQRLDEQNDLIRLKQNTESLIRILSTPEGVHTPTIESSEEPTDSFLRWSPSDEL
jgi:hypothetical protein